MLLNHSFADAFRTYRNVSGRFPEILKHATEGEPLNVQNFRIITLTYHLPSPRTQVDRIFRRKLNPFGKRQRTNTLSTAISRSWGVGGGLHTWNLIVWYGRGYRVILNHREGVLLFVGGLNLGSQLKLAFVWKLNQIWWGGWFCCGKGAELGYFGSVDQQEEVFRGRVFDFELIFVCFFFSQFWSVERNCKRA